MIFKYLKFYHYYLEVFAKNISGRGLMNPNNNGEFKLLENLLKQSKNSFVFVDGGSNIGEHVLKFNSLCKTYNIKNFQIFAIEPFKDTLESLKKNLLNTNYILIDKALGKKEELVKFYYDNNKNSGQNSLLKHYYLHNSINIKQTTIDNIVEKYSLNKINFLKLDIEGSEYNALLGAKKSLSSGLIDYIQLEYNQTWIKGGGTIEKILNLAEIYSYKLFRLRKNDLLSIPSYNFNLDDFFFCNLLLVKNGCKLPLPCKNQVSPLV